MLLPGVFNDTLFDDLFDNMFGPEEREPRQLRPMERIGFPMNGLMKTDVKETDGAYELAMDLPGYGKNEVKAELKNGYLIIHASKEEKEDEKDKQGKYIRRERYYGSCSRSFYVGKDVTENDIKAKFDNGILRITVPKKEAKPEIEEKKYISIDD